MEAPRREPEGRPELQPEARRAQEAAMRERVPPRIVGHAEPMPFEAMREDIISWGAVWAGLVGALAVLVLLSLIGVGIGLSTPGAAGMPTSAAVWGIIVMAVAFFFGGWLAGWTSTDTSTLTGLLNGGLVWGLSLLLSFAFAVVGLGSLLGLPVANILGIIGQPGAAPTPPPTPSAGAVWTTVLALVIGFVAALLGGLVGARSHAGPVERL